MVTSLRVFLSFSRQLRFTVLEQLQNQRQLMLCPFSGHRLSRLDFKPRDALTQPLVQARKYLTHDSVRVSTGIPHPAHAAREAGADRPTESARWCCREGLNLRPPPYQGVDRLNLGK